MPPFPTNTAWRPPFLQTIPPPYNHQFQIPPSNVKPNQTHLACTINTKSHKPRTNGVPQPSIPCQTEAMLPERILLAPNTAKQNYEGCISRRTAQWWTRCYKRAIASKYDNNIILNQTLSLTKTRCLMNHGFCANPTKSLQQNFNKHITEDPLLLHAQPKNLTFHNLCTKQKLPAGTR